VDVYNGVNMKDIYDLLEAEKLFCGRMISAHKTAPQGCRCVWNGNVISPSQGKVWYGDLNLTKEGQLLKKVAEEAGEPLYVLREMDARFGTEKDSIELLMQRAVWNTTQDIP
jgi:hypothetical protein